jgi:superfamily II DNA/RNA helicase
MTKPNKVIYKISSSKPKHQPIKTNVVTVQLGKGQDQVSIDIFNQFKQFLITQLKLDAIKEYLPEMKHKPFFLLAATGLGKTVIVPLHNWLEIFNRVKHTRIYSYDNNHTPSVFVVVPTVTIAEDQVSFLNEMYDKFCELNQINSKSLFGCKTVKGSINNNAPIQFLTTGVFEAMAVNDSFQLTNHAIIIDEAHKVLETSCGFEVALTNLRYKGVRIDYMSATVDTRGLLEKLGVELIIKADSIRHPIYKYNTNQSMIDSMVDVIQHCLIKCSHKSPYLPKSEFCDRDFYDELSDSWNHRPSAMLAIVNSKRDIEELTSVVNDNFPSFPVLHYSSAIKRSHQLNNEFQARVKELTRQNKNYLIISTNVVEMGVTFDNLDWVITKDQEYTNVNDKLTLTPLKVNSLYQRLGRVGRHGLGIGIITNDGGSYYSSLPNHELNCLTNETINFPCQTGGDDLIAMNTILHNWSDSEFKNKLTQWNCPSQVHLNSTRVEAIINKREILKDLYTMNPDQSISNMGRLMHQMMNYTGLSPYNCYAIIAAYTHKDWSEFSFFLAQSIVAKYTFYDFPRAGFLTDLTVKENTNSIVEIYNKFCNTIQPSQPLELGDYGKNHFFIKELEESRMCPDYEENVLKTQIFDLPVVNQFYTELLELATTVLNVFAKHKGFCNIPIFETKQNGKNLEIQEINLVAYNKEHTILAQSPWCQVHLTGKARASRDGRHYKDAVMLTDLNNFNQLHILEYQFCKSTTGQLGWISAIHFTDILQAKYHEGLPFYAIVNFVKNNDGKESAKLLHAFFGTPHKFIPSDISAYSADSNSDDDWSIDADYYDNVPDEEYEESKEVRTPPIFESFESLQTKEMEEEMLRYAELARIGTEDDQLIKPSNYIHPRSKPISKVENSNLSLHPDCIKVLYVHISKFFYIGQTSTEEIAAWHTESGDRMTTKLKGNGKIVNGKLTSIEELDLLVYGYDDRTYTIANFVGKYMNQ